MKNIKKGPRTKAQTRARKERRRRRVLVATVASVIIIVLVSSFIIYSMLYSSSEEGALPDPTTQFKPENPDSKLKAVIVDQLSLTAPNETFIQTAATILTKANYAVDYYAREKVNVEFYRNLPTGEYDLIILRVHSALSVKEESENVALFSCEPYSEAKYAAERLRNEVVMVRYFEGSSEYLGISPNFVKNRMNGYFHDAVIVMMGCYGLTFTNMADAFIEQGAKAYIGWNWTVSSSHTDQTTIHILYHLTVKKQTIEQAVSESMKKVGPDLDPTYNCTSVLLVHP